MALYVGAAILGLAKNIIYLKISGGGGMPPFRVGRTSEMRRTSPFLNPIGPHWLLSHFSRLTLCDPIDGSPPGSRPWDSPGRNTGVGCHFLLQCMKVKSKSEVTQSCPTLSDLRDCSLPGSSIHGIFQARVLEWGAIAFSAHTG